MRFPDALKRFPGAMTYPTRGNRLEQKDIDSVVICTADHHHAVIANWLFNRVRELIRDDGVLNG